MSIVGKMHIDGVFEGKISSMDSVSIGRKGEVYGQIHARQISVSGLLDGEIHCDELTVDAGGKVRGLVYSENMVVAQQGCFVGERHLKKGGGVNESPSLKALEGQASTLLSADLHELPDRVTLRKN